MLTFDEALSKLAALEVAVRTRRAPLMECAGRVCAQDVRLDRDQPGFDRATMDGYALALDGERDTFEVVATVTAGGAFERALEPGQGVRIMTGAPCPTGATVVPIELTDGGEREVRVRDTGALRAGRNIARRGEDGHAGDRVLAPGTRLGPANLAAAAMAGADELEIFDDPRVAIVTTGDEVGQRGPAGIRDTNGPMLEALLRAIGCAITRRHARDDERELERALDEAGAAADVLVTTGGVSMGSRDLVPDAIARCGYETVFHKVAIQPGKPVLLARHPAGRLFLGLPGNPVSVLATAHLFLLPALRLFAGARDTVWAELPIACDFTHSGNRHLFLPARLGASGVTPVRWNGSGDLYAAAAADGFVSLPAGSTWKRGASISFLPYVGHVLGERGELPPRGGVER